MFGRFFHRVQIIVAGATPAASKMLEKRFSGRRCIHPDRTTHDFREGLASTFDLPQLFVGIEFQGDCLCCDARKIHEVQKPPSDTFQKNQVKLKECP